MKDDKVALRLNDTINKTQAWNEYDAIILATGYRYDEFNQMLSSIEPLIDSKSVGRSYQLDMKPSCDVKIFLQGCCESSHGLVTRFFQCWLFALKKLWMRFFLVLIKRLRLKSVINIAT